MSIGYISSPHFINLATLTSVSLFFVISMHTKLLTYGLLRIFTVKKILLFLVILLQDIPYKNGIRAPGLPLSRILHALSFLGILV